MATKSKQTEADTGFTNFPDYDPAAKGVDYGGDDSTLGTGNAHDLDREASEKGYIGQAPGEAIDGDLSVDGIRGRDVVADAAEAKADEPDGDA